MKVYNDIRDMLCDELEEIAKKKELTSNSLEIIGESVDILKDIATIEAMEESGYSNGRVPYYDDIGNSYARRDERGRYSRDTEYHHEGYSRDTKEELREIMDKTKDERDKEVLRKALDSMK